MYIGGDGSWNFDTVYIYADQYIRIKKYSWSESYDIIFDIANYSFRPAGTSGTWSLGSSAYPFTTLYTKTAYFGGSTSYGFQANTSYEFRPNGSGSTYLGTSSYQWTTGYIKTLYLSGDTSYGFVANTSRELRPLSTYTGYPCYLGTSSYPWHYAYLGSVQVLIGTATGSKIGFYGTTPITRKTIYTVSTSATVSVVATKLNELIGYLKNYGLLA